MYFLGKESLTSVLAKEYFRKTLSSSPLPFVELATDRSEILLRPHECSQLHEYTFLSNSFPFGLINKSAQTGQIERAEGNIHAFNEVVSKCISNISNIYDFDEIIKSIVKCIVPLCESDGMSTLRTDGSGFSAHWLKGAIFLSLPQKHSHAHLELTINLVHEMGHQALMFYQDADPIISQQDFDKPVYSMIRKTHRPAIMSLHALVAIYFMYYYINETLKVSFHLPMIDVAYLNNKKSQLSKDFAGGCFALKNINFSPLGSDLLLEMIEYFQKSRAA